MTPPPDDGRASLLSSNCGFIPADWCAAQGRELPANAKATNNDKAIANAMPSVTARGRGKPSGLMAFLLSATRETANRFWRHNDLIEVKDRRFESHTKRICASELLDRDLRPPGATKTNPKRSRLGSLHGLLLERPGVSGDGWPPTAQPDV